MSSAMTGRPEDTRALSEQHTKEAERLLKGRFLSSHVKGQIHATLALYYAAGRGDRTG